MEANIPVPDEVILYRRKRLEGIAFYIANLLILLEHPCRDQGDPRAGTHAAKNGSITRDACDGCRYLGSLQPILECLAIRAALRPHEDIEVIENLWRGDLA